MNPPRRLQLFEFCDQQWLQGWLREAFFDCLSFTHNYLQPYYHVVKPFAAWAHQNKASVIQDFGSGSGEQIAFVIKTGTKNNIQLPKFILSDLFPQLAAWRTMRSAMGSEVVDYVEPSLSALNPAGVTSRYWCIFTAFHHFPPQDAGNFLREFTHHADSLCIMELSRRVWPDIIAEFFLGLPVYFFTPFFASRFKWQKLLFTTFIPVVSLMVWFDGFISILRSYTKEEIIEMLPEDCRDDFEVEYHEVPWRFIPAKATMLTITRKAR